MRIFLLLFLFSVHCFSQNDDKRNKQRDSLIDVGLKQYRNRDTINLKKTYLGLLRIYHSNSDSVSLAKVYHYKALIFRIQNKLDSSYYYYNQSKNISIRVKDSTEVARRLLSMAYMQNDERDYLGAESSGIEGLRYIEPLNEITYTVDFYNILGNISVNMGAYEEARKKFNYARTIYNKSDSEEFKKIWKLYILNNIGNSYLLEGNPEKAMIFLKEGLDQIKTKEKYPRQYQSLLGNYAECLYLVDRKEEAWDGFLSLIDFRKKINNLYGQSLSHNAIAFYHQKESNLKKALYHAKKGYDLAKKVNNNATRLSALLKLGALTSGSESKSYYQEYAQLSDSLNNRERYLKNQFAKVRYETEKKDKENATLKLQKEQNEREIENQRQQKIIVLLLGTIGLLVVITYFRNRRKKLVYETQLQKAAVREKERQQIAKSLHDEVAGDLRMLHQKLTKNNAEEAKSVENIKENVRNLSHQLSSTRFDQVSFKDQIINLISDAFSPNFRIKVESIDTIQWGEINDSIKRTIYICIRESLQNTLKHAEASQFVISFSQEKKEVFVEMKDNGKGFEKDKKKTGIGLKNLQERVEEIRGIFSVASSDKGTQTNISIPLHGK